MKRRLMIVLFVSAAVLALGACHDHDTLAPPPSGVAVTLSLPSDNLAVSQQRQFTATVTGATNNSVTWSVNDIPGGNASVGTVDSTGRYTAPASVPSPTIVTVKATSVADPTKSGAATVTILSGVSVTLNLSTENVAVSQQKQFVATVTGAGDNNGVTWYVNDVTGGNAAVGTIDGTGLYTAPASPPAGGTVTVKAKSVADPTKSGMATVTITGGSASPVTIRVSMDNSGVQGNDSSSRPSVSADGRFVVFESVATNLVSGDSNGQPDIFVRDLQTGQTTRVNVSSSGTEANETNAAPTISGDGRFVAFYSYADNLVPDDFNAHTDVFVRDRQTGQTTRVSVDNNGLEGNTYSYTPSISADGRYVAFYSGAINLVSGDTNGKEDVFVKDRQTGRITRVSVDNNGVQGNGNSNIDRFSISADGRYVAFYSGATNLVPNDTNASVDVFVHDRDVSGSGTYDTPGNIGTTRVNVDSAGNQTGGFITGYSISANGRYVAFSSSATNLIAGDTNDSVPDIYVYDRQTGVTTLESVSSTGVQAETACYNPRISADGRYVAFESAAWDLVSGHTGPYWDIFVRDRQTNQTSIVSVDDSGAQANGSSTYPAISGDGRVIAFESDATNLISGDTNAKRDVFVRQLP